jgi:hypothetical protein
LTKLAAIFSGLCLFPAIPLSPGQFEKPYFMEDHFSGGMPTCNSGLFRRVQRRLLGKSWAQAAERRTGFNYLIDFIGAPLRIKLRTPILLKLFYKD